MIVLGFDTATRSTAVALRLADGSTLQARHDPSPDERPGHTTRLLGMAGELLARAGIPPRALERIAVGLGPGTFTGLRVGVATARGLAQSLARDLGPKGIHVVWINIDGGIDLPHRQRPGVNKEDLLNPDAIAETYWHLAHQDRSAWTMEMELRPFKEKF